MNLKYKRNRKIAWIIIFFTAILSIFILGGWKLNNKRNKVQEYFFNGENGFSIRNDIDVRIECSHNLLTLASRLDYDQNSVKELKEAVSDAENALTVREYFDANQKLTTAFDALYTKIYLSDADESEKRLAGKQADEFLSREKTIQKDKYNEKALSFNTEASKFPANIIRILSGVDRLDLFRNGG